jgi:hypothetical protein
MTARRSPGGKRFLHVRHGAADQHQVATGLHRTGADHVDRGALHHRVGRLDACGNAAEVYQGQRRFDHVASCRRFGRTLPFITLIRRS